MPTKTVEVMVRRDIKEAALLRARSQAQNLSGVCRAVVTRASAGYLGGVEPVPRRDKDDRVRIRFVVDSTVYEAAKQRAEGAVSAFIEEALERYAINGKI